MNRALLIVGLCLMGLISNSCELNKLLGTDTPIRILAVSFMEVPPAVSDTAAMTAMRNNSGFFVSAREFAFFTSDSSFGRRANRIKVTQAGSSHSGSTELYGGQDFNIHPAQSGVPSSMSIVIGGVETPGETGYWGVFEFLFNDRELITGSGGTGGEMEFKLESYNTTTKEATGSFMFVSHDINGSDPRRWAVKGAFTLRED